MKILKLLLSMTLIGGASAAFANPVLCSPGYQDSTCGTPLRGSGPPQPQCSTGPGWTTSAASVWQGSRWSQPACNYQPPPSCPPSYIQSGPSWNGSQWVGLVCTAPAPPPPPPGPTISAFSYFLDCIYTHQGSGRTYTGTDQVIINKLTYADGSVSYYQYQGRGYPNLVTLIDSQGRYYNELTGDNYSGDPLDTRPMALNPLLGPDPAAHYTVPNVPGTGVHSTCRSYDH